MKTFWIAPSVRNCYKNALALLGDSEKFTINAAKGEFVSLQLCFRNHISVKSDNDIRKHIVTIKGVEITQSQGKEYDISSVRVGCQEYFSFGDGIEYPEPISNKFVPLEVLPNTTRTIWLTFPVDELAEAGEYVFDVRVDANYKEEIKGEITLKVYDVQIPPSYLGNYSVEHFTSPDYSEVFENLSYGFKVYDDKWWSFMEEYARSLRECRSNIYRIYPLHLLGASGSKRVSENE